MAWTRGATVEEVRREFLAAYKRGATVGELLGQFQVKKSAAYALIQRANREGVGAAVVSKSRRPRRSPSRVTPEEEAQILEVKSKLPNKVWGAKKLKVKYGQQFPEARQLSVSSFNRVLKKHGLVKAHHGQRSHYHPLKRVTEAKAPNVVWTVDFKGLTSKTKVSPLNIVDVFSRCWLGCFPWHCKTTEECQQCFIQVFKEYGLPQVIRVDKGAPWASQTRHNLTRLSAWFWALGIRMEVVSCKQNYVVERLHRTCEDEMEEVTTDVRKHFAKHRLIYNTQRPHEALQMRTPAEVYQPSHIPYSGVKPYDYRPEDADWVQSLNAQGLLHLGGTKFYVSEALVNQKVGIRLLRPLLARITFRGLHIIDLKLERPVPLRLSGMS